MKRWMGWLLLPLVLALAGVAVWFNLKAEAGVPEGFGGTNGRLELQRLDVASLYAGRVERVLVDEGDAVEAGQVLAALAGTQSASRLAAAQAELGRAQEAVLRAEAGIRAQREQLRVARMEYGHALDLRREKLIAPAELTRRRAALEGAQAALESAEAVRAEALAAVRQAEAGVRAAADTEADMQIRAPLAGRVEYRLAEPGQVLAAGSRVLTLLDQTDVSMAVFLPTDTVGQVQVGDEARIVLDAIDAVWPATVSFVAADAQFTPKYVETASEREKLMYRVRLRIPAEVAQQYPGLLKGGMVGRGYVRLQADRAWPADWTVRLPQAGATATARRAGDATAAAASVQPAGETR